MIQGIKRVTFSLMAVAAAGLPGAAQATGPQTFANRCSMCHQPSGAGLPGQFPRLNGRVAQIATSPEGRRYLAMVLLYGIYGPITVDDRKITGLMPGGATSTACQQVSYTGTAPATVRLWGTVGGTGLAPYLTVKITRGTFSGTPAVEPGV